MRPLRFTNGEFIKSAVGKSGWPELKDDRGLSLPEIAAAGRSNVGKSSLLNHLVRHRSLAKTSATPGKTQMLNFFSIDGQLSLVDLPGYGYAKVPPRVKEGWGAMVQGYLAERSSLKVILMLLDIRRIPNEEDCQLLEWIAHNQRAVILVLTKVDKVTNNERKSYTDRILKALPYEGLHYVHYSTLKNVGRVELIRMIQDALMDEMGEEDGSAQ